LFIKECRFCGRKRIVKNGFMEGKQRKGRKEREEKIKKYDREITIKAYSYKSRDIFS
jgi:hypothetical protein